MRLARFDPARERRPGPLARGLAAGLATALLAAMPCPAQEGPPADRAFLDRGIEFFRAERYADAIVEFRAAQQASPDRAETCYYLGATLCELDRPDEAIVQFKRGIAADPGFADATAWFYLARAVEKRQCFRKALAIFRRLVEDSDSPRLAQAAAEEIRRIDALYAGEVPATTPDFHYERGLRLLARGDIPLAEDDLEEILLLEEAHVLPAGYSLDATRYFLAVLRNRQQRFEEARRLLALLPDTYRPAERSYQDGLALYNLERRAEAATAFRRTLAKDADHAFAQYYLGICLALEGDPEKAQAHLEQAARLQPALAQGCHYFEGLGHYRSGAYDRARPAFEAAAAAGDDAYLVQSAREYLKLLGGTDEEN